MPLAGLGLERSLPGLDESEPPTAPPPCVTERRRSPPATPLPFSAAPFCAGDDASGVPVVVGRPAWNWGHSDAPGRPVELLKLGLRCACEGVCESGARSSAADEAESWSCVGQYKLTMSKLGRGSSVRCPGTSRGGRGWGTCRRPCSSAGTFRPRQSLMRRK